MRLWRGVLMLLALLWTPIMAAQDLLMVRSKQPFPEAMSTLQQTLTEYGYTVARVQRVDVGLEAMGYKTDKYRVVFFGKPEEIRRLSERYPELVPYLPLKISIFAEADQTVVVAVNPASFKALYPESELVVQFDRWERDFRAILEDVRLAE